MKRYRFVGTHADETDNGPVEPGQFIEIDPQQPRNADMIEQGVLIEAPETKKEKAT